MKDFINPDWQAILKHNGLDSFEAIWDFKADWFEPPNLRRRGWSGVARLELDTPAGEKKVVFLKRQKNHNYRSFPSWRRRTPTFRREMRNIQRFTKHGIPVPEAVYYGERKQSGKDIRAILMTASLPAAFRPLEDWYRDWQVQGFPAMADRQAIIQTVAFEISKIHNKFIRHRALASKHIFIKFNPGQPVEVAFIDLENAQYMLIPHLRRVRDLQDIFRTLEGLSLKDALRFYKHYQQVDRLTIQNMALLRAVNKEAQKRERRKATKQALLNQQQQS